MTNSIINSDEQYDIAYQNIRQFVISAQSKIYKSINSAMVNAYWQIGRQIFESCNKSNQSIYGKNLLNYISKKLVKEFGKGFDESNLRNMRRFYKTFPIQDALRPELSWTHYRLLMKIDGDNLPIGIVLCAEKSNMLVKYTLPENNNQIYAAKYFSYMPTEDELKKELNLTEFKKLKK